jgi:hypothetical protein
MGVLACSRKHCDQIMCDTYINSIGYLCYKCKAEFKKYAITNDLRLNTENKIIAALHEFIHTCKGSYEENEKEISIDEFFNQYTK